MKKNTSTYPLTPLIAIVLLIAGAGTGLAAPGSAPGLEQEASAQASQLLVDKKYEQAALVLERLLSANPELKSEAVYKQLTHIYDNYLFDFDKALLWYRQYLVQFPQGTFAAQFRERSAFLEQHRSEWRALKAFAQAQLAEEEQGAEASIAAVEAALAQNGQVSIAPVMHGYLAKKYFAAGKYEEAGMHTAVYIAGFDQATVSSTEKANAWLLYSEILVEQKDFGAALAALDQAAALGNTGEYLDYDAKKASIVKQRNAWYEFLVSLIFFIGAVGILLPIRFWQHFNLRQYARQLAVPVLLLALVTVGSAAFLKLRGEPVEDLTFFFGLLALSFASLVVTRLLAPLSRKTGRLIYMMIGGLHMAAAAYMTFYLIAYVPV